MTYSQGEHSIEATDLEVPTARELRRDLARVFGDSRYKPPVLPAAAHELMALSKRPNVSFEDVQAVIEKDASIAGKVLQIAQSPIYATRTRAKTLRDAVQRLGLNNIRDIVWQVAMDVRVFKAEGYEGVMAALQQHSVATAYLARVVCRYASAASDYAFLCGLLHDVGLSGLLISVVETRGGEGLPAIEALWPALTEAHAESSGFLVRLWKLDRDLQTVVTRHHAGHEQERPNLLVATLTVAERLATDVGLGVSLDESSEPMDAVSDERFEWATKALGIGDATFAAVRRDATEALDRAGIR